MVFRKGGYLAAEERWFWDDQKLEVVNTYKYLGQFFFLLDSFTAAMEDVAIRAKKGTTEILRALKKIGCNSLVFLFQTFLMHKLFQHCCMQLRSGVIKCMSR